MRRREKKHLRGIQAEQHEREKEEALEAALGWARCAWKASADLPPEQQAQCAP